MELRIGAFRKVLDRLMIATTGYRTRTVSRHHVRNIFTAWFKLYRDVRIHQPMPTNRPNEAQELVDRVYAWLTDTRGFFYRHPVDTQLTPQFADTERATAGPSVATAPRARPCGNCLRGCLRRTRTVSPILLFANNGATSVPNQSRGKGKLQICLCKNTYLRIRMTRPKSAGETTPIKQKKGHAPHDAGGSSPEDHVPRRTVLSMPGASRTVPGARMRRDDAPAALLRTVCDHAPRPRRAPHE